MIRISVQEKDIALIEVGSEVFVCLTDLVKGEEGDDHIKNWMRNRNTVEFWDFGNLSTILTLKVSNSIPLDDRQV